MALQIWYCVDSFTSSASGQPISWVDSSWSVNWWYISNTDGNAYSGSATVLFGDMSYIDGVVRSAVKADYNTRHSVEPTDDQLLRITT